MAFSRLFFLPNSLQLTYTLETKRGRDQIRSHWLPILKTLNLINQKLPESYFIGQNLYGDLPLSLSDHIKIPAPRQQIAGFASRYDSLTFAWSPVFRKSFQQVGTMVLTELHRRKLAGKLLVYSTELFCVLPV